MKIVSICFSGSNPSMGPHDVPSSNTLQMAGYPDQLRELLDDTMVNGAVVLRKYLQLHLDGMHDEIAKVHETASEEGLNVGERIVDLIFEIDGAGSVTLSDLRRFSLTGAGYESFDKLIRKHGTKVKTDGLDEPDFDAFPDLQSGREIVDSRTGRKLDSRAYIEIDDELDDQ